MTVWLTSNGSTIKLMSDEELARRDAEFEPDTEEE